MLGEASVARFIRQAKRGFRGGNFPESALQLLQQRRCEVAEAMRFSISAPGHQGDVCCRAITLHGAEQVFLVESSAVQNFLR